MQTLSLYRKKTEDTSIEAKTAECLRSADAEAAKAKEKSPWDTNDIDDRRRLARITCKDHERDCRRDPHGLACLMSK